MFAWPAAVAAVVEVAQDVVASAACERGEVLLVGEVGGDGERGEAAGGLLGGPLGAGRGACGKGALDELVGGLIEGLGDGESAVFWPGWGGEIVGECQADDGGDVDGIAVGGGPGEWGRVSRGDEAGGEGFLAEAEGVCGIFRVGLQGVAERPAGGVGGAPEWLGLGGEQGLEAGGDGLAGGGLVVAAQAGQVVGREEE